MLVLLRWHEQSGILEDTMLSALLLTLVLFADYAGEQHPWSPR
jgi:hypothetical protein